MDGHEQGVCGFSLHGGATASQFVHSCFDLRSGIISCMKYHLPIAIFCVFVLAGCAPKQVPSVADGNPGAACQTNEDCVTPGSYLMRSNCPFESRCFNSLCAVVCPMRHIVSDGSGGWKSQDNACSEDSDCDCAAYAASDLMRCACVDRACWAIVKEG